MLKCQIFVFLIFHGKVITSNLGDLPSGYDDFIGSSKPIKFLEIFSRKSDERPFWSVTKKCSVVTFLMANSFYSSALGFRAKSRFAFL